MQKILPFITIALLLTLHASTEHNVTQTIDFNSTTIPHLTETQGEGTGGNPEVYIAHTCLKNKSSQTCLKNFFNDDRKIYLESLKTIKLASRGSSVEKATITLEDDELFLLYLDITNVKIPLTTNIIGTTESTDENSILFILPVKNIKEEIIVKDNEGNIVLQYKVRRQ